MTMLISVWGSGSDDVWAVGGAGVVGKIWHWDGSTWSNWTTDPIATLVAVWGSGSDDVWAVGGDGLALHWNGAAWTAASTGTTANLAGIWAGQRRRLSLGRRGLVDVGHRRRLPVLGRVGQRPRRRLGRR